MRTSQVITIVIVLIALSGLSAYSGHAEPLQAPTNPSTTNLVSWWALNETSGTRDDAHGTNDLTDNNTVGYTAGLKNNSADFVSANTESLSRADPFTFGEMTLGVWAKIPNASNSITLLSKWNTSNREIIIRYVTSVFTCLASNDGTAYTSINVEQEASPSVWYFVACSFDGDDLSLSINNGSPATSAFGGFYNGTSPFMIGARADGLSPLTGNIDEVFYYSRSLSDDELSWLYNSGTGRSYCEVSGTCTTPTATYTPSLTYTPSITPTPSNTPSHTPTVTNTPSHTPTVTNTPSNTPTITNTPSHTPTITQTPSHTPTITNTPTDTPTITETPTITHTPTITKTPTITPTPTITNTPGNWTSDIGKGDVANVTAISLLCLVVILFGLGGLIVSTLQKRKKP